MAVTLLELVPGELLGASNTVLFLAAANTQITLATFTNTDSSPHVVTAYIVEVGGGAGAANTIVSSQTLAPNQSWSAPQMSGRNMTAGDLVSAVCDTAGVVNLFMDGFTY